MQPDLARFIIEYLFSASLLGFGRFIYDFQTIIAGLGAIGAAYMAARPVYRQLGLLQTQTNGVHRAMLLERQVEIEQALAAINQNVSEKLRDLSREYYWSEPEDQVLLNEHQAHEYDNSISGAASYLRIRYAWRDNQDAENQKAFLLTKLDNLIDILQAVHYPAHHDQFGEDYAMSDEDYAAFCARGEAAKSEIYPALNEAKSALDGYLNSVRLEREAVIQELKKLDRKLISA